MKVMHVLTAAVYLILGYTPAGADTWTLDRTVKQAVSMSNSVAIEKLGVETAYLDAESAHMGWFPSLSLSSRANFVNKVMEIHMPLKTIRFGDYDSYDFKIRLNQLLYDGGRLNAIKEAAESRSHMSSYQSDAVALAVEFKAKSAFFRILMAAKSIEASTQSAREAENHLKDVRARYSQGMALENEVLLAQLRISQTEMECVSRQVDLEKAQASFRKIVGLEHTEEVVIEWNDEEPHEDISPDIQKAFDMRPEFKAFNAALKTAEKSSNEARAGKLPSIGLYSTFNYGKPGLDLPANEWMTYYSGGVFLNWNIWDWGTSARNVEKALLNRKKTIKYREDFKSDIEQQLSEALAEHTAAKRRAQLSKQAADVAQSYLKQITSAYREGMATEIGYDNAHASFTRTISEKSVSEAALWLTKIRLEYVLGIRYTGGHNE